MNEELKKLPDKPGVYIMMDNNSRIIYIGKAVVLKNRVRQYFNVSGTKSPKTSAMISEIASFEYIVTDNELEALMLECNMIKKHKPRFNILLRDDKSYPYIKITVNEEFPRILYVRRMQKDGARYFGPYLNMTTVRETMDMLKKLFHLKTCKKKLPGEMNRDRPCLNYHIGHCSAPCQGFISKEEYSVVIKDAISFLEGEYDEVVKKLENRMMDAAEKMEFEKAAALRNRLKNIKLITEKQKVLSVSDTDQDVAACYCEGSDACVQIFFVRKGRVTGRKHFILKGTTSEEREILESFLKQNYNSDSFIPSEVIISHDVEDKELIEKWLSSLRGKKVFIKNPKKGDKKKLVSMAMNNARISLKNYHLGVDNDKQTAENGIMQLSEMLGIPVQRLERIEGFDVSNTGDTEIVASMVVFLRGRPANDKYRRFKIKNVESRNDYASMSQAISRRLSNKDFEVFPDLILADGGQGHVGAVEETLKSLGIDIPVAGMVKDEKHRTRGIIYKSSELNFSNHPAAYRLVSFIQNEAHRFAINYNRKLRQKRYNKSVLDEIEGVGGKRKKALLKHFYSIRNLQEASLEDLLKVEGINRKVAENIYSYFKG